MHKVIGAALLVCAVVVPAAAKEAEKTRPPWATLPTPEYAYRAHVVQRPTLYPSRAAKQPLNQPGTEQTDFVVTVINDDDKGKTRRPQVLCVEGTHQLALYVDPAALERVTTGATVITAAPVTSLGPDAPGIYVVGGTPLEILGRGPNQTQKVRYRGAFLTATGVVPPGTMDLVFIPSEPRHVRRNGLLLRDVTLLDAPGGKAIATITRKRGVTDELTVEFVGEPEKGFQRIRFTDHDTERVVALGWVPVAAIQLVPGMGQLGQGSASVGGPGPAREPRVTLKVGTLLVDDATSAPLGVVTREGVFGCEGTCAPNAPRLHVSACGETVVVRAVP